MRHEVDLLLSSVPSCRCIGHKMSIMSGYNYKLPADQVLIWPDRLRARRITDVVVSSIPRLPSILHRSGDYTTYQRLVPLPLFPSPRWPNGKVSASRAADLGSNPAFVVDLSPDEVVSMIYKLVHHFLPARLLTI